MPSPLKIALKSSRNTIPAVQNMLYPLHTQICKTYNIFSMVF